MSQEMCRICLTTFNLTPLFNEFPDQRRTYSEFVSFLTGLEIKPNDTLPQAICLECKQCIDNALNLRVRSQQSHQWLSEMGFGKTEDFGSFENLNEIKCEFNADDSVFSDNCNVLPVKREHKGNPPVKVKKENEKIITKIKNETKIPSRENKRKLAPKVKTENEKIRIKIKNETKKPTPEIEKNKKRTPNKIITFKKPIKITKTAGENERDSIKKMSGTKEERTRKYLSLVKGVFDPNGPMQCNICNKTLSKWSCFTSHARIHLGIKVVCEHCGKEFVTRGHMNRHCRSQHGMEKVLSCPYCPFKAIDTTTLKHHTRREHTGERPYICDYCSAAYFSRRCLIQHIDSHLTSATVQCEQCPQFFKSRRHLSRHKFQVHTCKLYMYQCPICKQEYKNGKYVRVHLRKVHNLSAREHKIIKIRL